MARIPENTGNLYQFKIEMVKPGFKKDCKASHLCVICSNGIGKRF